MGAPAFPRSGLAYTVTESGGTVTSSTLFTVDYAPGGLLALAPVSVTIGGVSASSVSVISDTKLTAVCGTVAPGNYSMEICEGGIPEAVPALISVNTDNTSVDFVADATPLYTVTESGGSVESGIEFTVNYAPGGFTALNPNSVTINSIPATSVNVISDTKLKAVCGTVAPGNYNMEICG